MQRHEARIRGAGARVVVVGNGTPNFIEGFRERTGFEGEVLTDPGRKAYEALALRRSVASVLDPRTVARAFSAMWRGARQTRTQGDPWQQGGVFLVHTDGTVGFSYRSRYAGDHPSVDDILRPLGSAVTGRTAAT